MIVAKIELWPHGSAEDAEVLGIVMIRNIGHPRLAEQPPVDPDLYEYEAELQQPGSTKPASRRVKLVHWRRRGWVHLLREALAKLDR